jgi:hypothetical protein
MRSGPRRALANLLSPAAAAALPKPKARFDTGPCPFDGCYGHIVADHARDSISHSEPVCPPFEREMRRALGHGGRPDVFNRELGVIVPDLPQMKREADREKRRGS